ncbi:DUF748 domain-containing protein [Mariprofundus ferrooxydans]|uniref:OmpA-like domain-containing protein n=1 Tax=Mariprofundus ferrooxydans PV-1 TaxID=314345 RepID=Q0F0H3_9PROT|nr:DUF748 domain-containing protein [Mariprofundus ferrooxydans]EAU55055.1 hypothetical protein SPV1_06919 [Mariprofundus ferrooxydans PV-1]KON46901.1 hypothetical protein AL013_10965 [Mariprofundus ferrooxydans]
MSDTPKAQRYRWLIWVCSLLLLSVILLSLLPEVLRVGAQHWLRDHGAVQAQVEDIDFNPFTGSFVLVGLNAGKGMHVRRLSVKVDWLPLLKRKVLIHSLHLHGGDLRVQQDAHGVWQFGSIRLDDTAGEATPEADAGSSDWQVAPADVQFSDINLHLEGRLSDKPLSLSLPIQLLTLHLRGADASGRHGMSLRFQTGPVDLIIAGYNLAYTTLETDGDIRLDAGNQDLLTGLRTGTLRVGLGRVSLKDMDGVQLASLESVDIRDLGVHMDGKVTAGMVDLVAPKVTDALTGNGAMGAKAVKLQNVHVVANGKVSVASLSLDSVTAPDMNKSSANVSVDRVKAQQITVDPTGAIAMAQLEAGGVRANNLPGNGDQMKLEQLLLKSVAVDAKQQVQLASLALSKLQLERPSVSATDSRRSARNNIVKLVAVDEIKLNKLHMTGVESGGFDQLLVNGWTLPAVGGHAMGRIGSVKVTQAAMKADSYHVKRLQFAGLDLHIERQKDGKIAVLDKLSAGNAPEKEPKGASHKVAASDPHQSASQLLVDELIVAKGSRAEMRDASVLPAFDTRMVVEKMRLAPLDLSGKRKGSLDMRLKLGEAGQLVVTGEVRPGPSPATQLKVSLKRFKMPELSGYIEPDFGKSIRTGQLDLDSTVSIADGHIDSANKLMLRGLTLGDSAQQGTATQGLTMPLGMSLDMLRDGRGDIALDVPVKGLLTDPNINIHDIINKALLSSLSSGAMTYAALVLQPYGSIVLAANLASGMISDAAKPRLTPIIFEPRSSALTAPMAEYAGKIAGLMKEKGLRLQICGVATSGEGVAVAADQAQAPASAMSDQQLLELATARSNHVQEAIASHGVKADQLFGCRPQIDAEKKKAKPRVELLLD